MKTNFKPTDTVTILRAGLLNGATGTVLSNKSGTDSKPLTVVLDNNNGTWSFNYNEVISNNATDTPNTARNEAKPEKDISTKPNKIKAKTGVKRAYTKRRDKPIIDKPKRAYKKREK